MINLDSVLKSSDITLSAKVHLVSYGSPSSHVWMWEFPEHSGVGAFELVLEKTLESPLDSKAI